MLPIEIEQKLDAISAEIAKYDAELVDIVLRRSSGKSTLTIVVDKENGITLDDCADINKRLSHFFDDLAVEAGGGFFNSAYYLEVNSPGLDRPLKTQRDFSKSKGSTLKLVVKDETGKTFFYAGALLDVKPEGIDFLPVKASQARFFSFENIIQAVRDIRVND